MPAFYLGKPRCQTCNRDFKGDNIGHGEPDSPFVFMLYTNVDAETVSSFWIEKLADPNLELRDQWLKVHDKEEFIKNFDKNKNKSLIRTYYEQERIKKNGLGYLYSDVQIHLK